METQPTITGTQPTVPVAETQPIIMVSYLDALRKNLSEKQQSDALETTQNNGVRMFNKPVIKKKTNDTKDNKNKKYENKKAYDSKRRNGNIVIRKINKAPQNNEVDAVYNPTALASENAGVTGCCNTSE